MGFADSMSIRRYILICTYRFHTNVNGMLQFKWVNGMASGQLGECAALTLFFVTAVKTLQLWSSVSPCLLLAETYLVAAYS